MLIMEGGDLMLVGTKPVSILPGPPRTAPSEPLSQTYTTSTHGNQDSGRVNKFFEQNGQGRVVSQQQRSRPASRQRKHAASYVDDTLFGGSARKHDGSAVWESGRGTKQQSFMFGEGERSYSPDKFSDTHRPQSSYKRGSHTERPASPKKVHSSTGSHSRPESARVDHRPTSSVNKSLKRQPMKFKHTPSYVDDLLFGAKLSEPDFQAPWGDHLQKKGHHFDYTNYKTQGPANQYGPPKSCHATSLPPSAAPGSRPGTAQKKRHNASYVDDALFGPKLTDPGWSAPWEEKKETPQRMNIYDAFDHKVTIRHEDVDVVRPRSSVTLQRQKPPSTAKPVWR